MRDHEPHPADHAGDGDGGGRQHRGAEDHRQTQAVRVDAHGAGFIRREGQQVHAPAKQQQGRQPCRHTDGGKGDGVHTGAGEAAHEPVGDLGQLVGGIGHQLDIGGTGREQRAYHDTGQQEAHHTAAPGSAAHQIDQGHGQQAGQEGENGDHHGALARQDRQRRTEAGTGGRAQDIRCGHGVLEHGLVGGAGGGEAAAHQTGQQDTGQADIPHGDGHVVRPGLFNRKDAGEEYLYHLAQGDAVAAQHEGQQKQRQQR